MIFIRYIRLLNRKHTRMLHVIYVYSIFLSHEPECIIDTFFVNN